MSNELAETNVNVDHDEIAGNDSVLTFDEVESLTETKSDEEAMSEAKAMAKSDDKVKEVEKEAADEVVSKSENATDDNVAKTLEEAEEEIKKITGKFKDDNVELPADAVFTHKVDGKDVEVSFQDLLNNYAGKVPWDKKFQELSEEKKSYQEEKKLIESYISEFAGKMQEKDIMGALEYFAGFAGVKPLDFRKQLNESLFPKFEQYQQMNETERKAAELQEENEYYKRLQESDAQRREVEQSNQELKLEVKRIQEAHNISEEDYLKSYDELKGHYDGEITPQLIGEYHVQCQAFSKAEGLLTNINPDLMNDEKVIESLATQIVENPEFADDDWSDMIKEVYGEPDKKSKSKSVSKKVLKNESQEAQAKQSTKLDEFFSFDEI